MERYIHTMGFGLRYLGAVGLAALFSVSSYGQLAPTNTFERMQKTPVQEEVLPPIFANTDKKPYYDIASHRELSERVAESFSVAPTVNKEIITIEPGVPEFKSKGDAGRYVANHLGILSLYAKAPVGNAWKLDGQAKVKTSLGLRNLTEPRLRIIVEDVANSGFNAKLESRVRKPAEASIYKRIDGGEIGVYGSLERKGDVRAYIGIQANSMRIFNSLK